MAKDLTGTTLGKYQVMERLGRGGMADVYRAYQPGMDRYVAIKVMHGHLAEDPTFVTRFKREAQSVGNLRHPNIVQVIDFDVQDDEYYMVMEYIQGDTLKAMLKKRGPLPVNEALEIASKLADAVAYAHNQGMVHRDIKPANVLMTPSGNPVLTDFGIARLLDVTGLTASGMAIGTPAYMSPEAGRGEKVDERADIYSLGIVLYEMLTGVLPYDADTPYAVILKHINDPLPLPRQFVSDLPDAVERITLKVLAKNREDRFQTAGELHSALEKARAGLPVDLPSVQDMTATPLAIRTSKSAPSDKTVIETAQAQPQRRNNMPIIIGAVVVILALLVGGSVLFFSECCARPTLTQVPAVTSTVLAAVLPATTTAINATSTNASTAVVVAAPSNTVPPTIASTITVLPTTAPTQTPLPTKAPTNSVPPTIAASATVATATTVAPTTIVAAGGTASPQVKSQADPKYAALFDKVIQLAIGGDHDGAIRQAEDALKADPKSYDLLVLRARVYAEFADTMGKVQADADAAIKLAPNRSEAYIPLGQYYQFRQKPDDSKVIVDDLKKAVSYYTQAIDKGSADYYAFWLRAWANDAINDNIGSDNNVSTDVVAQDFERAASFAPKNARFYWQRGQFYYYNLRYPEAISSIEQSLALQPDNTDAEHDLAASYILNNQKDKAYDLFVNMLDRRRIRDPRIIANGAFVAWTAGQPDKAAEWAKLALTIEPNTPSAIYVQALLDWDAKKYDDALAKLDTISKIQDRSTYIYPFLNKIFNREVEVDRGRILTIQGKIDEALQAYDKAIANDDNWVQLRIEQAALYRQQGKMDEAREALRRALAIADNSGDDKASANILNLLQQLGGETPAATSAS